MYARKAMAAVSASFISFAGLAGGVSPSAGARVGGTPLKGEYLATSNGDWAKTNRIYHDENTVRQVWTLTSTCIDSTNCSGQVRSSAGWTADLNYDGTWWYVNRVVDNWDRCPDGTASPGDQKYHFWGVDAGGQTDDANTELLAGSDTTYGRSGACGVNKPRVVTFPLRLQKIGPHAADGVRRQDHPLPKGPPQ